MFKWEQLYSAFVNLSHRGDRLAHITSELSRVGIRAERFEAIRTTGDEWNIEPYKVMFGRTRGAIGCMLSQIAVMQKAYDMGKGAFVMEDDLWFADDVRERFDYAENWLNKQGDWDIFWGGALFHCNPPYWHNGKNEFTSGSNLGKDAELTDDPSIIRTFGCFSTHCYWVRYESIQNVIAMLNDVMSKTIGIDASMILMQPYLKTYTYVPGCCRQIDNMSDIGLGQTVYSNFSKLNGTEENSKYWFQPKKELFDPTTFNWAEAAK